MSHGVRGGAAVRPNRGPHSHLHATDPVDTPPILRGRRSASAYPKAGAPARQPIKVPHLSASGQVAGVVDAAGGHGASRVDADDSSHARLDQDLFAKDLFAKETINVARSESGSLLADAMGASASASHGASAPSHLDSGMGWSQRPFVIVTNPVPHPKNTDGASTAVAGESKDGPGMAKAVHPQNMLLEPVSPSIQNQVNVGYFETGDDFLDACRELLANHHEGVLFWIDVDLSVMTTSQQLLFFQLFRFNQITRNDCVSEDRYVSDTRVARYLRYLFCIVDTVDDISAVTPMDEIQEDIAGAWITKNLNIVLFEFGVVSVHLRGVDVTDDVVGRINTGRGVIPSCGWILWCLLDVMTDQMSPFLDASVAAADAIDSESVKLSAPESLPKLLAAGPAPGNRCQRYSTTCCCRRRSTGEGESSDDSVAAPASSGDFLLKMGRVRLCSAVHGMLTSVRPSSPMWLSCMPLHGKIPNRLGETWSA